MVVAAPGGPSTTHFVAQILKREINYVGRCREEGQDGGRAPAGPREGSTEAQKAATAAARLDGGVGRLRREMKLPGAIIMH